MNGELPDHVTSADRLAELAQARRSTRASRCVDEAAASYAPEESAEQHEIGSLQFRLRSMLVVVAAVSGLFAVMQFVGAVWSAVLIWFLMLVLAHVTANFWGTRVAPRAGQTAVGDDDPEMSRSHGPHVIRHTAGPVRLSECNRPGWPMFLVTAIGAIVGGTIGGLALALFNFEQAGYTGVVVGTLSAALVGGFFGFLTSTFAEIGLRAWNEAVRGANAESICQAGHDAAS